MNPIILPPKHERENVQLTGANTGAAEALTTANARRLVNILGPSAQAIPAVQEILREIPAGISSAAGSVLRGETDPIEIAYNGLIGEAASQVNQLFSGVPVADLLVSNVNEARRASPNYTAATLAAGARTGAGMLGQAILPIPGLGYMAGSTIGNYFAQESIRDGYLGDWADSRSNEMSRDELEDQYSYSVGDTKEIMAKDIDMNTYAPMADPVADNPIPSDTGWALKSYYEKNYKSKHEAEGPGIGGSGGGEDRTSKPGGMGGV